MSSRWVTRSLQAFSFLVSTLAAILLLGVAGLWWWSGTDGSLAWALGRIARTQPLRAEGVQGSLRHGLRVQRLLWDRAGLKVEALDVALEWEPLQLIAGTLHLDQVHAATLRIQDRRPAAPGGPPRSLRLPLNAAVDELKIGRLEWAHANSTIEASDLAGRYRFDGAQHHVQLDSLRWGPGSYRGRASIGAGGDLPVDAALEGRFQPALPGSTAAVPLDFSAAVRGPLTDLQANARLQVSAGSPAAGTRATAAARLTAWAQQPVPQAQADFQQLDVAALWPRAPHTTLGGRVQLQPAGTGTWAVTANLVNDSPGAWDQGKLPVSKLAAQGEWRSGGPALVRSLQAQVGGGELQAHGEWRGDAGWAVAGKLSRVNPAALYTAMAPVPVTGTADLRGRGQDVAFDVDLQAAGAPARSPRGPASQLASTLRALELRQGTARGRWHAGALSLPAFEIRTADARLAGSVEVQIGAKAGSGRVHLDAPGLRLAADGRLAPSAGAGTLTLVAGNIEQALRWAKRLPLVPEWLRERAAAGQLDARVGWQGGWRDPAIQARLALPLLQVGSSAAAGEGSAAAWTLRAAAASVDGRLSNANVSGHGQVDFGQRRVAFDMAGRAGRRAAGPTVWQGQQAAVHVRASDPGVGTGTWELALQRAVDLRWSTGSFDSGAGEAVLRAPAEPNRASANAPALLAWEPVRWRTGELRTSGRLTGVPMAWIELIGGSQIAGSALGGDMMFDAQWDASLGATVRLRASISRSRGDVTLLAETAQGTPTRVSAGVREARVDLQSDGEALSASLHWDTERGGKAAGQFATRLARGGATGWRWPEDAPVQGVLRAQLPRIGVWSLLAPPGWRLRGSLAADLTVAGVRSNPQFSGTLAADDLALRSVVDGVELQGGQLRARLEGQRLLIDEFMLHGAGGPQGGGTLLATGEGSWTSQGPQASLAAQLTRLRASIRSDRQVTVSGQLAARADRAGSQVTGTLKVDQARIQLPDQSTPKLGDDVVVRGAAAPPTMRQARAAEQQRAGARRVRLALDVNLGDQFRVQGHGIDTRLTGTLTVSGQSIAAARVTGIIRTAGGEYEAYGQRLDIERGVLRFTGAAENPSLDILAIRPNIVQRVGVQITGSVLTPYVRLYSEPEMADADKLSWLVLGRASANGGAEAALVQRAAMALLSSRSGSGKRGIAASLGLDELSFRRDSPEGPAVTLGKRLGRNFYAAYERSLTGTLGTLQVFYELTKRVTVRAETGARSAVDLIFTFAFD